MDLVYEYSIIPKSTFDAARLIFLTQIIETALSIKMTIKRAAHPDYETTFSFDIEDRVLRVEFFSGRPTPLFYEITVKQLADFIESSASIVQITTKVSAPIRKQVEKWATIAETAKYNFSRIISDLEKDGLVTTRQGGSILSDDVRFFTILRTSTEQSRSEQSRSEYGIGCLGTRVCEDITNEIVEMWSSPRKAAPAPEGWTSRGETAVPGVDLSRGGRLGGAPKL